MALGPDITCTPFRGRNDSTWPAIATILAGIATVAAVRNADKMADIADKQWKLAKKYLTLADNWLNVYKDTYAPVEDHELKDATELQKETPQYSVAKGRARVAAWQGFKGQLNKLTRCTSRYCAGLRTDIIIDLATAQGAALVMADNLGYRNERAYVEARNEVRFERRLNTAKRGRDIAANGASYARAAAGIYGDQYQQAWIGLTGAGQYLGYYLAREDTTYFGRFSPEKTPAVGNPIESALADFASKARG